MLKDEYLVAFISFEGLGDESFESSKSFCLTFLRLIKESLLSADISEEYKEAWFNKEVAVIIKYGGKSDEKDHNQNSCSCILRDDYILNGRM